MRDNDFDIDIHHPPLLIEAIGDAEALLAFSAKCGGNLKEGLAEELSLYIVAARTRRLLADEEGKFWAARRTLSECMAPVTIDSVKAITVIGKQRWFAEHCTRARAAESKYRYGAMIVLLLLLVFQVYWIIGSTTIVEIKKNGAEYLDLNLKRNAAQNDKGAVGDIQKAALLIATDQDLAARIKTLEMRQTANYDILENWKHPFSDSVACKGSIVECQQQNEARYQWSLIKLDILQRYFLYLLYGALGACVFVLRSLSVEIRAATYSGDSDIRFRSRLYLGALGGMVIAWFVSGDAKDGVLQSLSPFALAFVAGYGVELLFTAMDKIVAAFSSTGTNTAAVK